MAPKFINECDAVGGEWLDGYLKRWVSRCRLKEEMSCPMWDISHYATNTYSFGQQE